MESLYYFFHGLFTGLAVSVPLGPIGLVTIENTIARGLRGGMWSAVAVGGIDIVAAGLILFGFQGVIPYFHTIPVWLSAVGSIIIFIYGLLLFKKQVSQVKEKHSLHHTFFETILIIVSNPATYIGFGVIAFFFSKGFTASIQNQALLFTGFIVATIGWWSIVLLAANTMKKIFSQKNTIHKIIGMCLMLSALGIFFIPLRHHTTSYIQK